MLVSEIKQQLRDQTRMYKWKKDAIKEWEGINYYDIVLVARETGQSDVICIIEDRLKSLRGQRRKLEINCKILGELANKDLVLKSQYNESILSNLNVPPIKKLLHAMQGWMGEG